MIKYLKSIALVGGLGIGLAACGNSGSTVLTPPPPPTTTTYYQIERLSRPAVKEIFEPFVDHQKSNVVEPYADPTIQADITATGNALRPTYGTTLAGVLYPDEYLVNLDGGTAGFLGADLAALGHPIGNTFGGRTLNEDVIDTETGILFGSTLQTLGIVPEDNNENNCLKTQNLTAGPAPATTFPYILAAR